MCYTHWCKSCGFPQTKTIIHIHVSCLCLWLTTFSFILFHLPHSHQTSGTWCRWRMLWRMRSWSWGPMEDLFSALSEFWTGNSRVCVFLVEISFSKYVHVYRHVPIHPFCSWPTLNGAYFLHHSPHTNTYTIQCRHIYNTYTWKTSRWGYIDAEVCITKSFHVKFHFHIS